MTMLNIWIDAHSALVAVDTLASQVVGTETRHATKVLVLPHARCLVASRGDLMVLLNAHAQAFLAYEDFDGIVAKFLEIFEPTRANLKAQGAPDVDTAIFLVGFSKGTNRMEGFGFYGNAAQDKPFEMRKATGATVAPKAHFTEPPPRPPPSKILSFCRKQVASALVVHRDEIDAGKGTFGGYLITYEISKNEVKIRHVGSLDP